MRRLLWMLLAALACVSGEYLMGGHLDNNAGSKTPRKTHLDDQDLVAEESTVAAAVAVADASAKSSALSDDEGDAPRYHIPYSFAFNGGKPFSLEKDPITGKIDFEKTPPVKPLNYTDGHQTEKDDSEEDRDDGKEDVEQERIKSKDHDDVRRNEITRSHYFLPTHYSSDKYQYPLISSSYANTKVQSGANSYNMYNHRLDAENDILYARPTKNPHLSMTKTSTHKTTAAGDFKPRWTTTSPPTITTSASSTTTPSNSRTTLFSKAPVITTWKPSSTPSAFHTIDRTIPEMESEKNLLPIEKLHASGQAGAQRNPSNVPTRSPSDGTTTQKTQTNLDNLVASHARPETKPPAQSDEYKDSYDIYDLSDSEEEEEDKGNGDVDSSDDSKEIDYFFRELFKENVTTTSSTTSSRPTASTTTTTTTTTTVASSTGSTASTTTTVAPQLPSRSSTPSAPRENVFAGKPLQFSTIPQYPAASLNNDRRPSLPERHDGIISHVYRPSPMIKPEADRIGVGIPRIESTSNIVIPPDQNTVSFVLGNRQNVEGSYHSVGTAIGENLFGTSADISFRPLRNDQHGPVSEVKYEHSPVTKPSVTQKWSSPASNALKGNNELDPTKSQNPTVPPTQDVAVHNVQGNKDSDYVIFSDDETKNKDAVAEEHVVIINEADGSIRELPPKTTMTTTTTTTTTTTAAAAAANGTKITFITVGEDLPQLAQDLMPPAESTRPPQYYYHYQYDTSRPDHPRPPQRSPLPPRIKPHPGLPLSPLDPALRKRPYSPDTKLPNILPQFRPNAKASHGHRGPDAIGTMPAGQGPPTRIRQPLSSHPPLPSHPASSRRPFPLPPAPSYLQRLNPPPPPIHVVRLPFAPTSKVDGVALSHETEPTIRRFVSPARPPHGAPPLISHGNPEENVPSNRYNHGLEERNNGGEDESRKEDRVKSELEHENSERYPEEPPMMPPLFPKRRMADPPRVTTLQMLQHHGELNDESEETSQVAETVLAHEMERRKSDDHDPPEIMPEQPVYVVYPVNTAVNIDPDDSSEQDGSVVVGTRGPQRPLPPDTLLQDERVETHTIYNGKPVAADFPYLLELPDPSSIFPVVGVKETPVLVPSEQRQQASAAAASEREKNEQDAVNVIPYLQDQFLPYRKKNDAAISVTLHRAAPTATTMSTAPAFTSTPIAYVYTPTQSTHFAHRPDDDLENDANAAVDVKQTVLLPSQQPSSSSSSAPAPQNFMAPFVASMSAEAPSKNGWSVVVVDPPAGAEKKSDGESDSDVNSEADAQTEKNEFDADNFKPQLFGGFKPIYQFPTEDTEERDVAEQTDTELNMPRHFKELPPAAPDRRFKLT